MSALGSALRNGAGVLAASGGLAWGAGLNALDPLVLVPFSCLSVLWVASWAALPVAGAEARRRFQESEQEVHAFLSGIVLPTSGAGCVLGLLLITAAVGFVNVGHWHGQWLLPSPFTAAAAGLASLSASLLVAWWSILVALDCPDADAARRAMRVRFALLMVAWVAAREYLPVEWTEWLARLGTTHGVARLSVAAALAAAGASWWLARVAARRTALWAETPEQWGENRAR